MKSVQLNESNATLRLEGSEATRSIDIKNILVKEWPAADGKIKLTVYDEKDIPIYNQLLGTSQARDNESITVDKRFVFYDHLSVQFMAEREGDTFTLVINFE